MNAQPLFTEENLFSAESNAMIQDAIADGVSDMINAAEAEKAPKKKAKGKPEEKAKNNSAAKKPEPVTMTTKAGHSYELSEGTDPKALAKAAAEVAKSLAAIGRKDKDLLGHYLKLGEFQSEAVKGFKSSKLYGQFLAEELPASQLLDPALRSNCKWLWEALNVSGHEASDILAVLKVNRIEDFKSQNPTVIKREYKGLKAEAETKAAAEEAGMSVEEMEAEAKAKAEAEAKSQQENLNAFVAYVLASVKADDQERIGKDLSEVLNSALFGKKKDAMEYINSVLPE